MRELISAGRLTATGCMTASKFWPSEAAPLRALAGRSDIGLHLTLTDHLPTGAMPRLAPEGRLPPLGRLLLAAAIRRLDSGEIEAEIERQIDRFEAEMGFAPIFVDGHQHAHQLPVVRDALLAIYERRLRRHGTWLRYCVEPLGGLLRRRVAPLRAGIVALLGRRFARLGRKAGIPGNTGFRGVRAFAPGEEFAALMARFLTDATDGMLVMCHPAIPDAALAAADPVVEPRRAEYAFLRAGAFASLLDEKRVALVRFKEAAGSRKPAAETDRR